MIENCPNIKLNKEVIDYVGNFNSDENLLRSGGVPIDLLDNLAFGFSEKSITKLMPERLKIRWKNDLYGVKWEIQQEGISDIEWAKKVDLSEPIDVDYWESDELKYKEGFYIQDGHHRYYAAKILGKPLNVNLNIKINPIERLAPNIGYDNFHRCIFFQVNKLKNESIRKFVKNISDDEEYWDRVKIIANNNKDREVVRNIVRDVIYEKI